MAAILQPKPRTLRHRLQAAKYDMLRGAIDGLEGNEDRVLEKSDLLSDSFFGFFIWSL